jgi:arylsulfatase A-like enzyme
MVVDAEGSFMNRMYSLIGIVASAVVLLMAPTSPAQTTQPRRPNIIWIMADDMGYGDAGFNGQKMIKTPNMDALAKDGVRFTQVYAGSTVCAPSRCALMTGMDMGHALVRGNSKQSLRPEDRTVAEALKTAGYTTALVGKWGLGGEGQPGVPTRKGFDLFYGYIDQTMAHNSYPTFLVRNETREKLDNVVPNPGPYGQGIATEKRQFSNELMRQEALKFIDANKDRSFFLYFSPTLPHANNEAHVVEVPDVGIYKNETWPEQQTAYAAAVTLMDTYVGDILAKLKADGIDDNTIVFFTSDNGPHEEGGNHADFFDSNGPLRGVKRDMYEGGIRVPMVVRWPGHTRPGTTSEQMWAFYDFFATACDIAGADAPKTDGISMLPAILGQPQPRQHDYLYWEFFENGFTQAIRAGDWKAIRVGLNGPIELYNLKTDVGETRNVASENPKIVDEMAARFKEARTDSDAWPIR